MFLQEFNKGVSAVHLHLSKHEIEKVFPDERNESRKADLPRSQDVGDAVGARV